MLEPMTQVDMYNFRGSEKDCIELANKVNTLIDNYNKLLEALAKPLIAVKPEPEY